MTCRLLKNIKHSCEYNPGGITNIYLLDIGDFKAYHFTDESLFDRCYVERIETPEPFWEIGAVSESSFTETQDGGVYKQGLSTFVRTLSGDKLSSLLLTTVNKYLVAFRTSQGKMYCFGSDGGASLSFSQITGQMGEASGYQITINKESVFPLFEIDASRFNIIPVLGTEDRRIVMTEDTKNAILIY
ncbi:hypothetical protein JGH11_13220 [Dysgonomonas sp. Marseille-P4677]|uniref:hypothetical protein n=1 Tax=Dysgonomonas sp. Marseille-P4677 TaxID=2364790 RepID=UPI0019121F35|nr:hypothetical protein [Dysgonomonas sp. Marseille-P4677]MBK5721834.1 hypothetical protein [Dysgonomonas sp. Marseille-P4677]